MVQCKEDKEDKEDIEDFDDKDLKNPSPYNHIGDNLISDYLMPKKCGMKSFLYRRV